MPGVNITTAVRTGPVGTGDITAGQVFMVGTTERGPSDEPTLLRSFSDYTTYYGNYKTGNLYAHVKTFFDEGGTRCYVQRVVASDAAVGTRDLVDSANAPTMTITSTNSGAWTTNLETKVVAPDLASGDNYKIEVYLDDVLLLRTRDLVSKEDGIAYINASTVSHLIVASDADANAGAPVVNDPGGNNYNAMAGLANGSDGTLADADYTNALDLLSPNYGTGAVCMPGKTGATFWGALADHAGANKRIALLAFGSGDSASQARTDAATYYADPDAKSIAFYWPHIKVPAPNVTELVTGESAGTSNTITISPEAFVAGARSRAVQAAGGPWRAAAGVISAANTVVALAQDVTPATGDSLDDARVNALRKIGNSIRVYGARSASSDEANWRYITQQDTINFIVDGVEQRMERYVFSTIDGRGGLFGRIRGSIKGFLDPIRVAGGLFEAYDDDGVMIDPGYNVVVNSNINPATQLATGVVKAQVGVRVSGVADLIDIVITKSNLSAPII